jgi:hypothetical protein
MYGHTFICYGPQDCPCNASSVQINAEPSTRNMPALGSYNLSVLNVGGLLPRLRYPLTRRRLEDEHDACRMPQLWPNASGPIAMGRELHHVA